MLCSLDTLMSTQLVSHCHHLTHSCPHITPASITSPSLDSHMSTHFTTLWLVVVTWHTHVHTSRQLVLHCCHFTHSYRHIIPPCDMLWSLDTHVHTLRQLVLHCCHFTHTLMSTVYKIGTWVWSQTQLIKVAALLSFVGPAPFSSLND